MNSWGWWPHTLEPTKQVLVWLDRLLLGSTTIVALKAYTPQIVAFEILLRYSAQSSIIPYKAEPPTYVRVWTVQIGAVEAMVSFDTCHNSTSFGLIRTYSMPALLSHFSSLILQATQRLMLVIHPISMQVKEQAASSISMWSQSLAWDTRHFLRHGLWLSYI